MSVLAIAAVAAAFSATDPDSGITVTLSGRSLTVATGPATPAAVTKQLLGHRIQFSCARIVKRRLTATGVTRLWPAGATSVRVTLPRAVPHAYACGVETPSGDDIAFGFFS
jgi:hypothetical protein